MTAYADFLASKMAAAHDVGIVRHRSCSPRPTGGDRGDDMRVIALDLATGETRWELDPEGYPFVIGGRLVTDDNDGFVVYR